MAIDAVDRQLLREWQRDATIADDALGERLGLAPGLVRARRQALREQGVIQREVVLVDPALLGPELQVLALVGFARDDRPLVLAFEQRMAADPAVLRCHRVSGEYEYALIVRVRDAAEYALWAELALLPDANILHYSSLVLGAAVKDAWQAPVPLDDY